jgi:hypothetical protein
MGLGIDGLDVVGQIASGADVFKDLAASLPVVKIVFGVCQVRLRAQTLLPTTRISACLLSLYILSLSHFRRLSRFSAQRLRTEYEDLPPVTPLSLYLTFMFPLLAIVCSQILGRRIYDRLDLLNKLDLMTRLQNNQAVFEKVQPQLVKICEVLLSITRIMEDILPKANRRFLGIVLAWKYNGPLRNIAEEIGNTYEVLLLVFDIGTNDAIREVWQKLKDVADDLKNERDECEESLSVFI